MSDVATNGHPAGTGSVGTVARRPGYNGLPIVKPPVWSWEIGAYFAVGGIAGMSAVIAFASWIAGAEASQVLLPLLVAVAGAIVSTVLLVLDLGRPLRFLYMLRVFKWQSPMSVGAWILTAFGGVATAGFLLAAFRSEGGGSFLRALLWIDLPVLAILGGMLATYTGVLIGATAIPAWNVHRVVLPMHFGTAALGSAAGMLEILGQQTLPLQRLGVVSAAVLTAIGVHGELVRHGEVDASKRRGRAAWLLRAGYLLAALACVAWLLDLVVVGAALMLASTVLGRYGWLRAGTQSARDPRGVLAAQGGAARAAARG